MKIVLVGPPASGKGTQANVLTEKFGVPKISTGDMLREARVAGTKLGREAEVFMNAGKLVPDEVVMVPPRQVAAVPLLDRRARIVIWIAAAVLLALVAAAGIAFLALRGSSSGAPATPPAGNTGTSPPAGQTTTPPTSATGVTTPAPPAGPAPLVLGATGGDVWLDVRAGSATGKVLFQSTLAQGRHLRFARRRLWVRVGAPWNLTLAAAGKRLPMPLQTTGDMLVTAAGARVTA